MYHSGGTYLFLPAHCILTVWLGPQVSSTLQKPGFKHPAQRSQKQQKSCKTLGNSSSGEGCGHKCTGILSEEFWCFCLKLYFSL